MERAVRRSNILNNLKMKKIILTLCLVAVLGLPFSPVLADEVIDDKPLEINFENPLTKDKVEDVLGGVLSTIQGIVAILAVLFLVIGGIIYITSAGDEKRMTVAKGAILAAVIGFALAIAAPSFLKEIYDALDVKESDAIADPGGIPLSQIALNFLDVLLSFVGILAVIMLVVGGIMYIVSAGDETRSETAKKIVTYAVIGLGVAITSLIIVKAITGLVITT